jgi:glycerophosphoryl diester phosphodiesterase
VVELDARLTSDGVVVVLHHSHVCAPRMATGSARDDRRAGRARGQGRRRTGVPTPGRPRRLGPGGRRDETEPPGARAPGTTDVRAAIEDLRRWTSIARARRVVQPALIGRAAKALAPWSRPFTTRIASASARPRHEKGTTSCRPGAAHDPRSARRRRKEHDAASVGTTIDDPRRFGCCLM